MARGRSGIYFPLTPAKRSRDSPNTSTDSSSRATVDSSRRASTDLSRDPTDPSPRASTNLLRASTDPSPPAFTTPTSVVIDWGASMWRVRDSDGISSNAQDCLVVYNKANGKWHTGREARQALLIDPSLIPFEKLKSLFDLDSPHRKKEIERLRKLKHTDGIEISIENVLEQWWDQRFLPLFQRAEDAGAKVDIGIAHPAHFSLESVAAYRNYFKTHCRVAGRIVVSEEATAAIHGATKLTVKKGSKVLVMDGGKSTIDFALLQITAVKPALTTIIIKTQGLPRGANHINEAAREYAKSYIDKYREKIPESERHVFDSNITYAWGNFEDCHKRNLTSTIENGTLQKLFGIGIEVDSFAIMIKAASDELIKDTKGILENMIAQGEVDAVICLGGYCQSKELRNELLSSIQPQPIFEPSTLDGNTSDVLHGLKKLVLHPERAEWQYFPQHYLIAQSKPHTVGSAEKPEDAKEALLLCEQGELIVKHPNPTAPPQEGNRKPTSIRKGKRPQCMQMIVWVTPAELDSGEPVVYNLQLLTIKPTSTPRFRRYPGGAVVCDLEHTKVIREYESSLPRELFLHKKSIDMYVYITGRGQDIVVTMIWLSERCKVDRKEFPAMTLPEVLDTLRKDHYMLFETSVEVTAAILE